MSERPSRFGALKQLRTAEPEASPVAPSAPQEPEQGREAPETPPAPSAPVSGAGKPPRPPGKSRHPDYTQVTLYLRRDPYHEAQRRLVGQKGRDFSDVMDALLDRWLRGELEV